MQIGELQKASEEYKKQKSIYFDLVDELINQIEKIMPQQGCHYSAHLSQLLNSLLSSYTQLTEECKKPYYKEQFEERREKIIALIEQLEELKNLLSYLSTFVEEEKTNNSENNKEELDISKFTKTMDSFLKDIKK